MLTVTAWIWGRRYTADHVVNLFAGARRNLTIPHRCALIADNDSARNAEIARRARCEIWPLPDPWLMREEFRCWCRLRMYDPAWQETHGIERLVNLDLDGVATGALDVPFSRPEPVVLWRGGHFIPLAFNGSLQLLRAGAHPEVWREFTPERAWAVRTASGTDLGSDQTWLSHLLPQAAGFTRADGIYGFKKPEWPLGADGRFDEEALPLGARLVFMPGKNDPSRLQHLSWVRGHWKE